jgi:hypothetical protein
MQTFLEFLHGDNWKKPLLPDDSKVIRKIVRSGQQAIDTSGSTTTIPSHQLLMLALAQAGQRGLCRAEISGLVDLDGQVLDELLSALTKSGELAVSQMYGQRVYRRLL